MTCRDWKYLDAEAAAIEARALPAVADDDLVKRLHEWPVVDVGDAFSSTVVSALMSEAASAIVQKDAEIARLREEVRALSDALSEAGDRNDIARRRATTAEQERDTARGALEESFRQIRYLAEIGTDMMIEAGLKVDPAERTYEPIIANIRTRLVKGS